MLKVKLNLKKINHPANLNNHAPLSPAFYAVFQVNS